MLTGESSIRPEYAALAAEFERLTAPFGHRLDERLRRDIARLTAAIERIDRLIDEAPDAVERRARWAFVLGRMAGAPSSLDAPMELRDGADDLRALGLERGVLARLQRIVAKEARTSEAMRTAPTGREFVRLVLREGRLTAALALVVAGGTCGPRFRRFFFRLGGPANLIDKIKDAREDHARGEIALAPSPALYARLLSTLIVRAVAVVFAHPRPWSVVATGLRYLRP